MAYRYAGAETKKVLGADDLKGMSPISATYRSINNWKTVQETSFTGVPLYRIADRLDIPGGATLKIIASDGYFWPKIGELLPLSDLSRPNGKGLYPLLAFKTKGKAMSPEPNGSGPLRYVAPQYTQDQVNKPSWVSNVRVIEVGPLKKGYKTPSAKKVPLDQVWIVGNVPMSYPVSLIIALIPALIGVVLIMAALSMEIGRRRTRSLSGPVAMLVIAAFLAGSVLAGWPATCRAQQSPVVFSKGDLASMPGFSGHYTFLKQLPPYTYYEANYTGVPLSYLLEEKVHLMSGASQVVIKARDGYSATFSISQVNAAYPNGLKVIVAYAKDGQPITGDEGPIRLIVPQVKPGNRDKGGDPNTPQCVRMVDAVEIQPLPAGVAAPDPSSIPGGSVAVYGSIGSDVPAAAPQPPAAPAPQAPAQTSPQQTQPQPAATKPQAPAVAVNNPQAVVKANLGALCAMAVTRSLRTVGLGILSVPLRIILSI